MRNADATATQLVPTMLWEKSDAAQALAQRFRFADGPAAADWLLAALQQHYGITGTAVTRLVISAANLLAWVQSDNGLLLVKVCVDLSSHARLSSQGALVTWLAQQRIPVSVPLPALNGKRQVLGEHLSIGVQRIIAGELLNPAEQAQTVQAGLVLANLHQALARYPDSSSDFGSADPSPLADLIRTSLAAQIDRFGHDQLRAAAQQIDTQLASQEWPSLPLQLVHHDYRSANLLWHEDRINAVLDFEEARWGYRVNDVARATVLLGTRYHHWGPISPAIQVDFLAAYASIWPLTADEQRWWPLLIRWHTLGLANAARNGAAADEAFAALDRVMCL